MAATMNADRSTKYDRQLRLWGDHGQSALEVAQVCLVNATATGTEVLKSIILPGNSVFADSIDSSRNRFFYPDFMEGIASFTVVDCNKVSGEDVGNNYFLDKDSIGKSRAQAVTQFLLELNADVRGDFVDETPEHLLENNSTFFKSFTVVIVTDVCEKTLLSLAANLWTANIPLVICRTYGLIGYIRLQIKEHTVIESHPDNAHDDLRLDKPFSGLVKHVDSIDFDTLDKKDHSHTPYVIILMKYLKDWKRENDDKIPKTYAEKQSLKELIRKGIRKNENDIEEEEENFSEAIRAVNTAFVPTNIPQAVREIISHESCLNLASESKPFWIIARALKDFVDHEGNGCLPVRGAIPDMTADSDKYIRLQNVYRTQAAKDMEAICKWVQQYLYQLGKPQDYVTEQDVKLFCRNAHFLKLVEGRSLAEEYNAKTAKIRDIMMHLDNPESEMVFYVLLRAVERFYAQYGRFPGHSNDEVEPDIIKLKACLCKLLQEWGCPPLAKDDYVHEMCRYGAAELHSVAAFVGGCAAQEVIKLITGQYVPLNNTFIYNAMAATSATFEL